MHQAEQRIGLSVQIRWLVIVALMLALSACNSLQMPPTWKCHKAIPYMIYQRHACVTHEI